MNPPQDLTLVSNQAPNTQNMSVKLIQIQDQYMLSMNKNKANLNKNIRKSVTLDARSSP